MFLEQQTGFGGKDAGFRIAVVGSGISGLSAAWLLAQRHRVTLFEADERIGGHSHTVDVASETGLTPVDTGFIVFNEATYPNLTALFRHLEVETTSTAMTFAVSLDGGRLEYSGTDLGGLLAQRRNMLRPRFWSMMRDLLRFYKQAPRDLDGLGDESLHEYLDRGGYGAAFREDHLYPMAAAIWSTPSAAIRDYPAASFIRFCQNHNLLEAGDRPLWHTVKGGSRAYVARLTQGLADIRCSTPVRRITRRAGGGVDVTTGGGTSRFDHVVLATHADQALAMLGDADASETELLGAFGYCRNDAVLHSDEHLLPQRRRVWSAWNYASHKAAAGRLSVTYWMNRLQGLPDTLPLFVTLNPIREPTPCKVHWRGEYTHPVFNGAAMQAQRRLWSLQGRGGVWFCGAYFGAGFHEDGLQAGLAVAEQLGGVQRPWTVEAPSGRIHRFEPQAVPAVVAPELEFGVIVASALYTGQVMHQRLRPRRHRLSYRLYMLLLDLDELDDCAARLRLFSRGRRNLFSFRDTDHGAGTAEPLRAQVERHLRDAGLAGDGGAIRLLTMPRVLGFAFNPISVYFCYRRTGELAATLYEVNNTFGQRHSYLLPVTPGSGAAIRQNVPKCFHVSPFMGMAMDYAFRLTPPAPAVHSMLGIGITGSDEQGAVITAVLTARRHELTDAALLRAFFVVPLVTMKVVAGIGWEALKLWLKGVPAHRRPAPPDLITTLASSERRAHVS